MRVFLGSSCVRGKTLELTGTKGGCTLAYDTAQCTDGHFTYCEGACSQTVGLAVSRLLRVNKVANVSDLECGFTDTVQKVLGDKTVGTSYISLEMKARGPSIELC